MKVAPQMYTYATVVKLGAMVKVGASTVCPCEVFLEEFQVVMVGPREMSRGATFDRVKCCASSLLFFHSG